MAMVFSNRARILLKRGNPIKLLSGEGIEGRARDYTGARTMAAISRALTSERQGGDRWAHAYILDGETMSGEPRWINVTTDMPKTNL